MNIISKLEQKIPANLSMEQTMDLLLTCDAIVGKMYSYIVYKVIKNNVFINYVVQYNFSQNESYNTLSNVALNIYNEIKKYVATEQTNYVVCYGQPTPDIWIEAYNPLVLHLALKQHNKWNNLEYEDLCQMCRLCMLELYNKGYYLHKYLIEKAFNNYVLMQIRKQKNAPDFVSLDSVICNDECELYLKDIIPDTCLIEQVIDAEERETRLSMYNYIKGELSKIMTIRQIDNLALVYSTNTTSPMERKMLQKAKKYLNSINAFEKVKNKYL